MYNLSTLTFDAVLESDDLEVDSAGRVGNPHIQALIQSEAARILTFNDRDLAEHIRKQDGRGDELLDLYEDCGKLAECYKNGIQVLESVRLRLLVTLFRYEEHSQEGPFTGKCTVLIPRITAFEGRPQRVTQAPFSGK